MPSKPYFHNRMRGSYQSLSRISISDASCMERKKILLIIEIIPVTNLILEGLFLKLLEMYETLTLAKKNTSFSIVVSSFEQTTPSVVEFVKVLIKMGFLPFFVFFLRSFKNR